MCKIPEEVSSYFLKRAELPNVVEEQGNVIEEQDGAICELYETTLAQGETIAEQDSAICELYEMMMEV